MVESKIVESEKYECKLFKANILYPGVTIWSILAVSKLWEFTIPWKE